VSFPFHGPPAHYTYQTRIRILAWVGLVAFSLLGATFAILASSFTALMCVFFCAGCGWFIVTASESIIADEHGLTYRRLWRADLFLPWEDITNLRAQGIDAGLRIEGREPGKRIFVNARLQGYSDLVERILRKRPALFQQPAFKILWGIRFGSLALLSFLTVLALSSLADGKLETLAGFAVLTAGMAWIYLSRPLAVFLKPTGLDVRYGLVKKFIPLEDILTVRLLAEQSRRTSRLPVVSILLRGGRSIDLTGFSGGEAYLYSTLQLWLEERVAMQLVHPT
jgi:hypothetical protein